MLSIVHMTVNDKPVEVAVETGEVLVDSLRNRMGLTGVKKECSVGECGACTVLIDGIANESCLIRSTSAEGKIIYTVEGVKAGADGLHPIQRAFIDEAAVSARPELS